MDVSPKNLSKCHFLNGKKALETIGVAYLQNDICLLFDSKYGSVIATSEDENKSLGC